MKRLYLMITITNRVVGSGRFVDFYRAFGAPVVFTALGRGTASDDVLSYLGLEATEKAVLFSVVTPACKETLVKELVSTMHLTAPGSGIAVCLVDRAIKCYNKFKKKENLKKDNINYLNNS